MVFIVFVMLYPIKYTETIKHFATEYGLETSFVASVINTESHFNPNAQSKVGAIGLMQLLPATANYISSIANIKDYDLYCPTDNIKLGCTYLNYLKNKFNDKFTLLCAYNAGEGNAIKWLKDQKYSSDGKKLNTTPFNETNNYAQKVLKNEKIYKKFFS